MRMDEDAVDARVAATLQDEEEIARILALMTRPRDSRGVYRDGGCMDVSARISALGLPGNDGHPVTRVLTPLGVRIARTAARP